MEKYQGNVSENEDDPDVYQSSGDEWSEEIEEKKKGNRRASQRLSKKPRVSHIEMNSDSDDEDGKKKKSKNGIKRQKLEPEQEEEDVDEEEEEDDDEDDDDLDSGDDGSPQQAKSGSKKGSGGAGGGKGSSQFVNGGFLILKSDVDAEEPNKKPCLWRIDGKALLQKYEPFEEDGQLRHRNTSIYTGWSYLDKSSYYPVTVKVLQHQGQNMTVELNWDLIKSTANSDE